MLSFIRLPRDTLGAFIRERYAGKLRLIGLEEDTKTGLNQSIHVETAKGKKHIIAVPVSLLRSLDYGGLVEWISGALDLLVYVPPKRLGGNVRFMPGRDRVRLMRGAA